jgi:hypothetical protein
MPASSAPDDTLAELLASNRARDPEFEGGLANHQSMALVALAEMGASAEQLRAFAASYDRRLEPLRPAQAAVAYADIDVAIGEPRAMRGMIDAFTAEIRARGRDVVLNEMLPKLWPGVGTLAFHGVIRTAYAVRRDEDPAELAHGLAYWAAHATPLRPLPSTTGREQDASALVSAAIAREDLRVDRAGMIDRAMRRAAAKPGFDDAVAALAIDDGTMARLADAALRLYLGSGDFTSLHAVTGTHAVRVLSPWTNDHATVARWHWQALVAAALTVRGAKLPVPTDAGAPDWPALLAAACDRKDDHDVKLVDSCHRQSEATGAAGYRAAAALRLGLGA